MNEVSEILTHVLTPVFLWQLGIFLLLVVVLIAVSRYRATHRPIVPFKSEGGTVEISPQTIRNVMQVALQGVPGVEKAECQHFLRGKMLGVNVSLHLKSSHPLRQVENDVRGHLRDVLEAQFGIEQLEPINIRVTRMIGGPVAARRGNRVKSQTDAAADSAEWVAPADPDFADSADSDGRDPNRS